MGAPPRPTTALVGSLDIRDAFRRQNLINRHTMRAMRHLP
jgi:hypothetical protein